MSNRVIPVRKTMCKSCPFRRGSAYANLAPMLAEKALTESNRVCHSTGISTIYGATGKPQAICRGTRDIQLHVFTRLGVLEEPTDACWAKAQSEIQS